MTLSKLAQLANVSVSVVSKAFSGREDVSDAMREHVFAVAREHGCFQQFYHAPYDKPVIAVVIPELISQYYIHYMEAFKRYMEAKGYTMLLSISNFDEQMKEELVRYHVEHGKVDGLILFGSLSEPISKADTVMISLSEPNEMADVTVSLRSDYGLEEALRCLHEKGHRRIAYVGEPLTEKKQKKMKQMMTHLGMAADPSYMICSRSRFAQAGEDGVRQLWRLEQKPTAIIGAYGYITQGILSELERMGISVPEEVSVISMDSDPEPLHPVRDVACIPSEIEQVCEVVMEELSRQLRAKKGGKQKNITIQTTFRMGETVGTVKE